MTKVKRSSPACQKAWKVEKSQSLVLNEKQAQPNYFLHVSLSSYRKTKKGKPIKNYLDLFINTSLNHMSIRSRLVSQPNNKLNSNSEQSINATNLSPITFGVILPPKLHNKISTISQISPGDF